MSDKSPDRIVVPMNLTEEQDNASTSFQELSGGSLPEPRRLFKINGTLVPSEYIKIDHGTITVPDDRQREVTFNITLSKEFLRNLDIETRKEV
jgi:hypothetical protein